MGWFFDTLLQAVKNIVSFDSSLYQIVLLSLRTSLLALLIATAFGVSLALLLATSQHRTRHFWVLLINSLMGLPPILAGLLVYLLFSAQGPLAALGWLFTPAAMIVAQSLLIFPIVCGLSQVVFRRKWLHFADFFNSLGMSKSQARRTVLFESRYQVLSAVVTGLGRGLAEVGAVMIVGGNIAGHTRTMTTAIALEVSKGNVVIAISLGLILLGLGLLLNLVLLVFHKKEVGL